MAWTAEQKRARRAELAAARAAEDAAHGIKRRPPGGTPAGRHWDERAHAFVLSGMPKPTPLAMTQLQKMERPYPSRPVLIEMVK